MLLRPITLIHSELSFDTTIRVSDFADNDPIYTHTHTVYNGKPDVMWGGKALLMLLNT